MNKNKRLGLAGYSDQELTAELLRRQRLAAKDAEHQPVSKPFRVYAHYQDGSTEWWQSTFATEAAAVRAVRHYQANVWSGDPLYVVAPDGTETRVEYHRPRSRCGVCHNPNCTEPNGQH